jgi:hypothetical protein
MSLYQSPSIVTNGLQFYYDMTNIQKSFKGAPTTNLTPDLGIQAIQAGPTVTYVGVENGWKKYSLSGTWSAGTYPYSIGIDPVTFTGGVTYSSGVYIKTNVPEKFASLFTGMNYVNQPMNNAGSSFSITQADGSIFVGRSGFQYTSTTGQVGYLLSQPIVGQTFNGALDFVYIKQGQVEIGSFPTPFVAGTRSNTQAILDLMNNNTITATSLTYASDGTFSFNGSSNFITTNSPSMPTDNFTIELIVYPTSFSNSPIVICPQNAGIDQFIQFNTTGTFIFKMAAGGDVGERSYTSADACPVNNFSHIVCVKSGTNVALYRNGILTTSTTTDTTATAGWGSTTWSIGQRGNSTFFFSGIVPVVRAYSKGLTAAEVQQNFNALRGRYGL